MKQRYFQFRHRKTGEVVDRVFTRIGSLKQSLGHYTSLDNYEVVELVYTHQVVPDNVFSKYLSPAKQTEMQNRLKQNAPTNEARILNVLNWFSKDQAKNYLTATNLADKEVCFVFGANAAGIHGAGAAYDARQEWNAKLYEVHRTGDAYGFVTVDREIKNPVSEDEFLEELSLLTQQMRQEPNTTFLISKIGTGLAGLDPAFVQKNLKSALKGFKNYIGPEDWDMYN